MHVLNMLVDLILAIISLILTSSDGALILPVGLMFQSMTLHVSTTYKGSSAC